MNIHARVIKRIIRTLFIPIVVVAIIATIITFLTIQQAALYLSFSLLVFLFYLLYDWTLNQIKQEDKLEEEKEFLKNR